MADSDGETRRSLSPACPTASVPLILAPLSSPEPDSPSICDTLRSTSDLVDPVTAKPFRRPETPLQSISAMSNESPGQSGALSARVPAVDASICSQTQPMSNLNHKSKTSSTKGRSRLFSSKAKHKPAQPAPSTSSASSASVSTSVSSDAPHPHSPHSPPALAVPSSHRQQNAPAASANNSTKPRFSFRESFRRLFSRRRKRETAVPVPALGDLQNAAASAATTSYSSPASDLTNVIVSGAGVVSTCAVQPPNQKFASYSPAATSVSGRHAHNQQPTPPSPSSANFPTSAHPGAIGRVRNKKLAASGCSSTSGYQMETTCTLAVAHSASGSGETRAEAPQLRVPPPLSPVVVLVPARCESLRTVRSVSCSTDGAGASAGAAAGTTCASSSCASSAAGVGVGVGVGGGAGAGAGVGALLECPLCLMEKPAGAFFKPLGCRHRICSTCMRTYVRTEISDGRIALPCPVCSERLHPSDIERVLLGEPELIRKYEQFMIRRVLLVDPDTRWCPAPDCGY